jgi:hypothetical protein
MWGIQREKKRSIEVTILFTDQMGVGVTDVLKLVNLSNFEYITTVGCCAGHPSLKLETVVPIMSANVELDKEIKTYKCAADVSVDGCVVIYNEMTHVFPELKGSCMIRPKKDNPLCLINPEQVSPHFKELLNVPTVFSSSGPSATEWTQEALAKYFEENKVICLEMEIGHIWQKLYYLQKMNKKVPKILPAFKGVSDTGAETAEASKAIRDEHRNQATYKACVAMLVFLNSYLQS